MSSARCTPEIAESLRGGVESVMTLLHGEGAGVGGDLDGGDGFLGGGRGGVLRVLTHG